MAPTPDCSNWNNYGHRQLFFAKTLVSGKGKAEQFIVPLFTALIFTFSAYNVEYSQTARNYILLVLAIIVSMIAFVKFCQSSKKLFNILFLGVSMAFFLYSHYYASIFFVYQVIALILISFSPRQPLMWVKEKLLPYVFSVLIAFLLFSPWLIFTQGAVFTQDVFNFQPEITVVTLSHHILSILGSKYFFPLYLVFIVYGIYKTRADKNFLIFILLPLVIYTLSVPALDYFKNYPFYAHQLIGILPFSIILFSSGLFYLLTRMKSSWHKFLFVFLAFSLLFTSVVVYFLKRGARDYYAEAQVLKTRLTSESVLIFSSSFFEFLFLYFYDFKSFQNTPEVKIINGTTTPIYEYPHRLNNEDQNLEINLISNLKDSDIKPNFDYWFDEFNIKHDRLKKLKLEFSEEKSTLFLKSTNRLIE